jgi:hypothetical protein
MQTFAELRDIVTAELVAAVKSEILCECLTREFGFDVHAAAA